MRLATSACPWMIVKRHFVGREEPDFSMRSQPKSLRALTLFSSSIKPAGMAPRPSRFQATSRSCSFRHARLNSTAKKISGNSCGRTGCRTEFSNPSTISSITAATPGTRSSISRGKSCPSRAAIGRPQVTQSEDWYKPRVIHSISLGSLDCCRYCRRGPGLCRAGNPLPRIWDKRAGRLSRTKLFGRQPRT